MKDNSLIVNINNNDVLEFDLDQQDILLKYPNAPASSLNNLEKNVLAVHCVSSYCQGVQCTQTSTTAQCTQCTTAQCTKCSLSQCSTVANKQVFCGKNLCNDVKCSDCTQCSNCYYCY